METERRILRSFSALAVAGLLAQVANLIFVVVIARAYTPDEFGEYSFALSLGAVASILVNFGTNAMLLRKCSGSHGDWRRHAGDILPFQMAAVLLLTVLIAVALALTGIESKSVAIISIVTAAQMLTPVWNLLAIGFTAQERMSQMALTELFIRLAILIAGVAMVLIGSPIEHALLVMPISAVIATLVAYRNASNEFGPPRIRFAPVAVAAILKESLPYFVMTALTIAFLRVGIMLLRAISGPADVAIFAAAERLVMAGGLISTAFGAAAFPALVRLIAEDANKYRIVADRSARLILLLALPLTTVVFLFAEDLVYLIFGEQYRDSAHILELIAWLIAVRGIVVLFETAGLAGDRKAVVVLGRSIALGILILMCCLLIPRYGALGLAWGMLAAQTIKMIILAWGMHPTGLLPSVLRPAISISAACLLVMAIVLYLHPTGVVPRILVVGTLGPLFLFLFGAVRRSDFSYALAFVSGQKGERHDL